LSGFIFRLAIAFSMAIKVALRIFILSISSTPTCPIPILIALFFISLYRASRFFGVSFLESFRPIIPWSFCKITAAA
jgi:hypothetical protein